MNDASSYIVPMNTNNIIEFNRNSITDKPHNNKPITKIEISPGGRYLVTYSQEDHSVVGWNIEDVDEGQLKSNDSVKINYEINQICVSDDKKLAYINNDRTLLNIIDIRNNNHFKIDMGNYYRLKSFGEYIQ
ncbi:unnamed protein product [Rhizophagus irregularis]|nr:unnamed protein product [Rhizophagus irregularis]CAB5379648.1 unnamed protein product [Rhizophagus irregularis]